MFEMFTERARRMIILAQEEARHLKHNYIGTEHLLLGLLRDEDGLAGRVLRSRGATLDEVRDQVESVVGRSQQTASQFPLSPRSKKILEMALLESKQLDHDYVGAEHILLGLTREGQGVANQLLDNLGVDQQELYREVRRTIRSEQ